MNDREIRISGSKAVLTRSAAGGGQYQARGSFFCSRMTLHCFWHEHDCEPCGRSPADIIWLLHALQVPCFQWRRLLEKFWSREAYRVCSSVSGRSGRLRALDFQAGCATGERAAWKCTPWARQTGWKSWLIGFMKDRRHLRLIQSWWNEPRSKQSGASFVAQQSDANVLGRQSPSFRRKSASISLAPSVVQGQAFCHDRTGCSKFCPTSASAHHNRWSGAERPPHPLRCDSVASRAMQLRRAYPGLTNPG